MELTREILYERHRLSHQQIDDWKGEKTKEKYLAEKLSNMKKLRFFLQLTEELNSEGIRFMILKGPLLSQRIYGDPTYRYMKDFDLLVNPESVAKTILFFENRGFAPAGFSWPKELKKQKLTLFFTNQFELFNKETGTAIEIHWRLFSDRIADEKKLNALAKEHTTEVEFSGQTFQQFTLEFELMYLIIHGGLHAWFRLKWLVDIHEILVRHPVDTVKFKFLADQLQTHRFISVCNRMLKEYFPDGKLLPNSVKHSFKSGEIASKQLKRKSGNPKDNLKNTALLIRYRMALSPRLQYKCDVLRLLTFCKDDLDFKWIPPYRFFYYLFRPIGYLIRKIS